MMKTLIENSIQWEKLGSHPKAQYSFSIRRAWLTQENLCFVLEIAANFIMPYENTQAILAALRREFPELADVRLQLAYEDLPWNIW